MTDREPERSGLFEMEQGRWEGVRFIESSPVIADSEGRGRLVVPSKEVRDTLVEAAKRRLGLSDDQASDMFIVAPRITSRVDIVEVTNRKELHRQELQRLNKR